MIQDPHDLLNNGLCKEIVLEEPPSCLRDSIVEALSSELVQFLEDSNTPAIQEKIQNTLAHVMADYQREGHIESYGVICDASTNPPSIVNADALCVQIWYDCPEDLSSFTKFKVGINLDIAADQEVAFSLGSRYFTKNTIIQRDENTRKIMESLMGTVADFYADLENTAANRELIREEITEAMQYFQAKGDVLAFNLGVNDHNDSIVVVLSYVKPTGVTRSIQQTIRRVNKNVYSDEFLAENGLKRITWTAEGSVGGGGKTWPSSKDYDDVLAFDDVDLDLPLDDDDTGVHAVTGQTINNNAQPWLGGSGHGTPPVTQRRVPTTPAPFPTSGPSLAPSLGSMPFGQALQGGAIPAHVLNSGSLSNGTVSIAKAPMTQSADLPKITFMGHNENDEPVQMVVDVESNITTGELARLTMLLTVASMGPHTSAFSVYAYIKKHNLERHFRITQ